MDAKLNIIGKNQLDWNYLEGTEQTEGSNQMELERNVKQLEANVMKPEGNLMIQEGTLK